MEQEIVQAWTEESYAAYLAAGGQSNGVIENKLRVARQRNADVNKPGTTGGGTKSAPARFGVSRGLDEPKLKTT